MVSNGYGALEIVGLLLLLLLLSSLSSSLDRNNRVVW